MVVMETSWDVVRGQRSRPGPGELHRDDGAVLPFPFRANLKSREEETPLISAHLGCVNPETAQLLPLLWPVKMTAELRGKC